MFRQQPMPMMQNGLIGGMQQQAPKNVLNVGGGAPKAPLQQQTLQNESEPLRGGIGSLAADSISGQFGQLGSGQYGNASSKSLEEVLADRGFTMPEKPTGPESQIAIMYKDPLTDKFTSGGPHAASHAKSLGDFYEQNPEAFDIAKQYDVDSSSFNDNQSNLGIGGLPKPPQIRTRGPESLAGQLNPMQQFVSNVDKERNSPQYQGLLKRHEQSRGQDSDAFAQLTAYDSKFKTQLAQIDPVQQQQYAQSTASSGPPASMPDMSLMQQPQMQQPQMQQPQPQMQQQYSQQDMQGMVGLMIQMFQKAMQNNGGQSNYNAGSFGGNNMQFQQPQYSPPQPQPMTGRQRFLQNSGNNPFGQY